MFVFISKNIIVFQKNKENNYKYDLYKKKNIYILFCIVK